MKKEKNFGNTKPRKGLFFCRRLILWGEGNFLFSFAQTSEK